MAVNASCPGVSGNVLTTFVIGWYAPMCCVIPPASVVTTEVWIVEQRRLAADVAHDRDDRRPRGVSSPRLKTSGSESSSSRA
jgi:hypothetical protein